MIDFHCHLDLYPNPAEVAARVVSEGLYVLAVTTTPLAWAGTSAFFSEYPRVRIGLGLHPQLVAERHAEADLLCSLIPQARYVGEIGLDGSPDFSASLDLQKNVLGQILSACATNGGRVLSIHSRGAATAVLDALEAYAGAGLPVMHWFSGTRRELDRAIAMGCWFSVGPAMLRGQKGRALASAIPRDRILTETDGPFAEERQMPLMPWDVILAEARLAELWGIPQPEVREHVLRNLRRLTEKTFV